MNHTPLRLHTMARPRRPSLPAGHLASSLVVGLGIGLALLALTVPAHLPAEAPVAQAVELMAGPARLHPGADSTVDDFYVHIPAGAPEPLQVVLVLHGMGGGGEEFSQAIRPWTDAQQWVIVAPTFNYGDWRDPSLVTQEAEDQLPRIAAFLDRLPTLAGVSVRPDILVYGYSRGGQTANRFALAFPERVDGVAVVSAGTYTLPAARVRSGTDVRVLQFPYGVGNFSDLFGRSFDAASFARIPFWIGVGARDSDPADVPHQWDPYIGSQRVERAQRFCAWLQQMGVRAQVQVFPDVGHGESDTVRAAAMSFLANLAS